MNKTKFHFFKRFVSTLLTLGIVVSSTITLVLPTTAAPVIKTQASADSHLQQGAVRGIDVSQWQGNIDWSEVAKDDVSFAFIRSSYGTTEDPYFVTNARNAKANGIKVGAYHYAHFRSTQSMKNEAEFFLQQLRKVDINYPVVLDMENHYGLSRSELTMLALQFIRIIESEGYTVMFYSYQNFFRDRLNKEDLSNTRLWVANYLEVPKGLVTDIWQHTSAGRVRGIQGDVDINIAYSTYGAKRNYVVPVISEVQNISTRSGEQIDRGYGGRGVSASVSSEPIVVKSNVASTNTPKVIKVDGSTEPKQELKEPDLPQPVKPTGEALYIDPEQSAGHITYLNGSYQGAIPTEGVLKLGEVNTCIIRGLQKAIGKEEVTGKLSTPDVQTIAKLDFKDEKNKEAVKLLQCTLFYTGIYTQELTGVMDEHTVKSIEYFQESHGLKQTGTFDEETIAALLYFKLAPKAEEVAE